MLQYKNKNFSNMKQVFDLKDYEYKNLDVFVSRLFEPFKKYFEVKIEKQTDKTKDFDFTLLHRYTIFFKNEETDFSIMFELPCLINKSKFMLSRKFWYPIFQVIDKPLISKPKKVILFQSNINFIKISTIPKNVNLNVYIPLNNSNISIPILQSVFAVHGINVAEEILHLKFNHKTVFETKEEYVVGDFVEVEFEKEFYDNLKIQNKNLINRLIDAFLTYPIKKEKDMNLLTKEYWTKHLNKYLKENKKNYDMEDIEIYLNSIIKIDYFTRSYMLTDSILKELLTGFVVNETTQVNFENKRIRFVEWLFTNIFPKVHIIYSNLELGKKFKKGSIFKNIKFNWTKIIDKNTRRLVKFEYNFNEITSLYEVTKFTQVGNLGTEKEFFRGEKRNIHGSQFGLVCPVLTPDRDMTGVTLSLALMNIDLNRLYNKDVLKGGNE